MLASPGPVSIMWGPGRIQLYNHAYIPIAGDRHPEALGRSAAQNWSEVYELFLGPVFDRVFKGETVEIEEHAVKLRTHDGRVEERFFTGSFSPVRNSAGDVEGVFHPLIEVTAKVRTAAELRAREARLRRVLDGMDEGFGLLAPDFTILEHNREALRLDGRPREQIVGRSHWDVYPESKDTELGRLYRQAMAERVPVSLEHRYAFANDRPRWLDMRAYPTSDGALAVFWRDVTDRKEAEARLQESEAELRTLADTLPVLVAYVDADERYRFVNKGYESWFGQTRDQILGRQVRDVVGDVAYEQLAPSIERALKGERFSDERRVPYKGSGDRHIHVDYVPRTGEAGAVEGYYVLIRDISDRKAAEARMVESEARFRNMADHAPVMMWVTDANGQCTYLNRSWYEFTGQAPEEAIGLGWLKAVHPDDRGWSGDAFLSANARCEPFRLEYRLRRKDGTYRWAIDAAAPRFGQDGAFLGFIGSVIDIDDRRTIEAALRESEERLRLAAQAAQIGTWDLDLVTGVGEWDEAALRVGGLDNDDGRYDATTWLRLVHPEDRELIEAAFLASLQPGGPAYDVEFRGAIPAADGGTRWITSHGAVLHDPETRRPTRAVGIVRDATARHRQQERLRESEARLRTITNAVPAFVWFATPDGHLHYFNDRWYEYTGQTEAEALPDGWATVLHPDDAERTAAVWADARQRGVTYEVEVRYRRYDGEYRWYVARAEPLLDANGVITTWFGTSTDIQERKLVEARLRELNDTLERRVAGRTAELSESKRRFQGIFDSALQFMALLTPAGTVVEVNQTALSWSQIEPSDIVGKPFWLAAPMRGNPDLQDAVKAGIGRAAAGETVREEHEMRGAGEVRAIVDFSLKPVLDEQGNAVWVVAEGRDITELKQAQEALRQSQKLEAVGQLTGGVAHDFNNLLTIIKSSTDLLRRRDLPEDRQRRYIDAISDTVDRASKLTGQLLAFARRQALKPEVFNATERVRSVSEMLGTVVGSRIKVTTAFGPEPCFVEADASQLETALVNLVVNARDAMDDEGEITVRVEATSAIPAIRSESGRRGKFVAVAVADTGTGIPEGKLAQIFEPFFTTKEVGKGTGLGLSQVYGFAKQSGGDVAVESELGRGSVFTLYLPQANGDAIRHSRIADRTTPGIKGGQGRRVLVVEDNAEVGTFSTQLLQDLGYETTWAANGTEALAYLDQGQTFDVVFSDVMMPGMSGVELGNEIRRRYPGLPVVLTSGYSHVLAEDGRHGFELLHKPYAAEQLSRVLRRTTRAAGVDRS